MSNLLLPLAKINLERLGDNAQISLEGEIDISNTAELEQAFEQLLTNDLHIVYLLLDGLEFFDSSGISLLVRFYQQLQIRQQRAAIVLDPDHHLRHVLAVMGLDEPLNIYPSLEAAKAATQAS